MKLPFPFVAARCALICWVLAIGLSACSPTLDWRQVQPEGSGLQSLFPCKPSTAQRKVPLAGATVAMTLVACDAGGATFAVAFAEVPSAPQVAPALGSLRDAALANVGAAQATSTKAAQVPGMTPMPSAERLAFAGERQDGSAVQEEVVFFAKGLRVFQATVVGQPMTAEALDMFFGSLRLPS